MERSADVLAAGLLEVSDPSLSSKFFLRQVSVACIIDNTFQIPTFHIVYLSKSL